VRQPVPFGKYLLLDRISVGGMAEVFKAKSYGVEGFEKIIAIKRILPTMGEDRDFIKMFIDEAKIAGQLAHANICQIFELGRIDGSHFIAMEYIWGKDLLQIQNRLRKLKQPMPVQMACFSLAKVLEGLDYAHRKRDPLGRPLEIVHRDCSPQNVLVSYEGEVKVIDFGIAKATSRNSRTMAGVLKGKFGYMSPEQVRGLPLDRRSDIFALGTMLYECLTGERLFQGETDFSTLEKVRNVDIRPPREINPNIPEAVEKVILKALAKDVDDRYQWCSEMLADLQQFLMSQDVVFTAKTLSSWLKEVFQGEIDKERQLLEQYKRVGRDGLINNVPAAESKADVNENFGEAGAPEGDATQLGGPSFEELEAAVAANASVGPASGSPAARGSTPAPRGDAEDEGDFGEEAPTEIFGEIDSNGKPIMPVVAPAAARPSTGSPATEPPKPPPRAPSVGNGRQPSASAPPPMAHAAGDEIATPPTDAGRQAFAQNYPSLARPGPTTPYDAQAQGSARQLGNAPTAQGFPSQPSPGTLPPPAMVNALSPPGENQGKTLMGAAAPPELAAYQAAYRASQTPGGYPSQPQMAGMTPQGMQSMNPSSPMMNAAMNPSQPQMQSYPMNPSGAQPQAHMLAHPSGQMPGQQNPMGYPSAQNYPHAQQGSGPMQGYGQYNQTSAVAPLEAPQQAEGRKKSSIGRDVAIGVAIAAVVLGGFLAVKFFILDADDAPSSGSTTTSTIATLKIELQPPVEAELFLDGNKSAEHVVKNGDALPINAGKRKVRIVARDGQVCERELDLEAGKTTVVSCQLAAATGSGSAKPVAGGSGLAPGPGSGSAKDAGSGSAKPETGKGSGSASKTADPGKGSAETVAKIDPKQVEKPKPPEVKPVEKPKPKPPDVKPGDKPKPKPPDKMPPEDNPADRAGAVQDGYVKVTSNVKAKVSVDGNDTGLSTPTKLKLSPGRHKIGFAYGTTKSAFPVIIKSGETINFHKDLE
jgi:serine/threonine protein kinase